MSFAPFGLDHVVALLAIASLACVVWHAGRNDRQARLIAWALALVLASYAGVAYVQKGVAGELSWEYSLPLELCHWVMIACLVSLLHPSRTAGEMAYFWGFGGTVQALVTPDLGYGFPSWDFIQFFWSHGAVVLAIVFILSRRSFRPGPGSVTRAILGLNVYAAVAGLLDFVFGWNYGYLRSKPLQPSLLDYLGQWPWYLVSLEVLALVLFWLLYLPWAQAAHSRRS